MEEGDEVGDENSDTFIPYGYICWSVSPQCLFVYPDD